MKRIVATVFAACTALYAHTQKANWQNLDLTMDSVFGISTEKAYKELLKNKKSTKVIVAIIDSGVDTLHEDLKSVLWTNDKEIPGNGIDDDHNGYIDDVHGWNFLGTEIGKEDLVNLIAPDKALYDSLAYTLVPLAYRAGYRAYNAFWAEYNEHVKNAENFLADIEQCEKTLATIVEKIGKPNPTVEDFKAYKTTDETQQKILKSVIRHLPVYADFETYKKKEITVVEDKLKFHLSHGLKLEADDNNTGSNGNGFVNNEPIGLVLSPNISPYHGTHVAGTIGAVRNNGLGIDGIADNLELMILKALSNIRELRDKNLAAAIRYAVNNGAKIINISFGKPFSFGKKEVDDAVKYAMKKDVLIIHAAGNVGDNLDAVAHYPNPIYKDSTGIARAWMEVSASGPKDDNTLAPTFSNYGKGSVDVFAPGVQIYSSVPGNLYVSWDGTSMAAPVVAGLAALIREYYPKLTGVQVKDIIIQSVVKRDILKDKCVSGGVVNAYNALKLASTYK